MNAPTPRISIVERSRSTMSRWSTNQWLRVALAVLMIVGFVTWTGRRTTKNLASQAEVKRTANAITSEAIAASEKKAAQAPAPGVGVYRRILPSLVIVTTDANDDKRADSNTPPDPATNPPTSDPATLDPSAGGSTEPAPLIPDTGFSPPDTAPADNPRSDPAPPAASPASPATPNPEDVRGLGTGVIINDQGLILTANHVVEGAKEITVSYSDGTSSPATIEGSEPARDIATLKPQRRPNVVVPAVLGGGVQIGDKVYAIGHPLGLTGSLSEGVVSGLNRAVPIPQHPTLKGLIQFDAAVNPGNSGGPLTDKNGVVVGIVTALANPTNLGFFTGIGFAVPIGGAVGGTGPGQAPPK